MTKPIIPSMSVDSVFCLKLMEALSPWLEYNSCPVGTRFIRSVANQSKVFFVASGAISLYRQPNDVLIDFISAPTLRGIIPIHPAFESMYIIKVIKLADIAILDVDRFYQMLSHLQLWEVFARHLMLVSSLSPEVIFNLSMPNTYDIVRIQLYELMAKPEYIREQITAESYIRSKSRISRSSVMRILADLRSGGFIVLENGILKEIIRLPKSY